MADERTLDTEQHKGKHSEVGHAQTNLLDTALPEVQATDELPAYSPSLLGDPRLNGRGNSPVRAAVAQRMQASYGNRATRRYLQRQAAQGAAAQPLHVQLHPVQEEQEQQPVPVQSRAASAPPPPVQRHPVEEEEQQQPHPTPVQPMSTRRAGISVQRAGDNPPASGAPAAPGSAPGSTPGTPTAAGQPTSFIVEDGVADLQPGQLRRSAFLAQLRTAVDSTVEQATSGNPFASTARSQVEEQFAQYSGRNSQALEQAIRSQVPSAGGAHSANEYISAICAQVRQTITEQMPKGLEDVAAQGLSAIGGAISSAASTIAGIFFKGRDGGPRAADAHSIEGRLDTGDSLPSTLRSGLEGAYGADLSGVRIHTDSGAAQLSDNLNARAFTVGSDIAFGTGEYAPGTLVGDALIAHEVAHVVQQGTGSASSPGNAGGVMHKGSAGTAAGGEQALEEDADMSALGAVSQMWAGTKSWVSGVGQNVIPSIRTGLRLQRCSRTTAVPVLSAADTSRIDKIKANLAGTSTGAHALSVISTNNVPIGFGTSGGGSFQQGGKITLDPGRSDIDLSFTLVHEAHHAEVYLAHKQGDIQTDTRQGYIDKMLDEETEAQALSIEARSELVANPGTTDIAHASGRAGEAAYNHGFKADYDAAKAAGKSEDEAKAAGKVGGRRELRVDFSNITTSTTHEKYPVYYGRLWDEAHK